MPSCILKSSKELIKKYRFLGVIQELQTRDCLSVDDIPEKKNPLGGPAHVDMPFITHITGECTYRSESVRERERLRDSTSSSVWLITRGPRQRLLGSWLHKPMCGPELRYISVYLQKEKVKKPLPKGDKEGVTIHSQNNTHFLWPGALGPLLPHGGRGHILSNPTLGSVL